MEPKKRARSDSGVKARFGTKLTLGQARAYKTIKKIIEKEEEWSQNHDMADAFRSYFREE